ncbi:GNAT family N-acetyltransferase [Sanyastnella coralliicola]|uniref:GNAT family N-acetyltransferase n=1 Tax=Sanyastnella coralliicola TaxID=3069118 RepID=UPI0027BA7188|nr:GNAT family N-acetyltransferase [Longitalea sp. SCSIO 12813]
MKWISKHWNELSKEELYDFTVLRIGIFVVEQDCPYPEFDGKDQRSIHLWCLDSQDAVVAYLRIVEPGVSYEEVSIGRVAVHERYRGSGIGRELMERGMTEIERLFGKVPIRLSAQEYLRSFYKSLGYTPVGDGYLEDGIPHIEMLYTP